MGAWRGWAVGVVGYLGTVTRYRVSPLAFYPVPLSISLSLSLSSVDIIKSLALDHTAATFPVHLAPDLTHPTPIHGA